MFAGERVRVHGTFFEVGWVCQYLVDATKKRLDAEVMGSLIERLKTRAKICSVCNTLRLIPRIKEIKKL